MSCNPLTSKSLDRNTNSRDVLQCTVLHWATLHWHCYITRHFTPSCPGQGSHHSPTRDRGSLLCWVCLEWTAHTRHRPQRCAALSSSITLFYSPCSTCPVLLSPLYSTLSLLRLPCPSLLSLPSSLFSLPSSLLDMLYTAWSVLLYSRYSALLTLLSMFYSSPTCCLKFLPYCFIPYHAMLSQRCPIASTPLVPLLLPYSSYPFSYSPIPPSTPHHALAFRHQSPPLRDGTQPSCCASSSQIRTQVGHARSTYTKCYRV